ncbi:hypothetical protein QJQ45_024521, partial [Haematococcus lacustris]
KYDAMWAELSKPRWANAKFRLYCGKQRVVARFWFKLIKLANQRWPDRVLALAYGAAGFNGSSTIGGRGVPVEQLLKEALKQIPAVRVVMVDESRTHRQCAGSEGAADMLPKILQPSLTGSNGVENRSGSQTKYSPFIRSFKDTTAADDAGIRPGFEVKDWEAQARDITTDSASSEKFKSLALHAEVKLAEALERCNRVHPTVYSSEGEERPNKLRTAVSCQLLGEFAELCGPFAQVLRHIRDELVSWCHSLPPTPPLPTYTSNTLYYPALTGVALGVDLMPGSPAWLEQVKAIYSSVCASERGLLVFDQLPWFNVAERLEKENEVLRAERSRFEAMLQEQQAMILRIEEQVGAYQRATAAAQQEAVSLRSRLDTVVVGARCQASNQHSGGRRAEASEESARLEARTGREELKRLRKEWMRLRDELEAERSAHNSIKGQLGSETGQLQVQVRQLAEQLRSAQAEAVAAAQLAASRPEPQVLEVLQAQLQAARDAEATAMASMQVLQANQQRLQEQLGSSTPRPSWQAGARWGLADAAAAGCKTQEVVDLAAQKLAVLAAAESSATRAAVALQLLLAPDPPAREITLAVVMDSSTYFITEEHGSSTEGASGHTSGGASSHFSVQGLGMGPGVPRCLRWPSGSSLQGLRLMSQAETQSLVAHIWQVKQHYDLSHDPLPLHAFLPHYFYTHLQSLSVTNAQGLTTSLLTPHSSHPPGSRTARSTGSSNSQVPDHTGTDLDQPTAPSPHPTGPSPRSSASNTATSASLHQHQRLHLLFNHSHWGNSAAAQPAVTLAPGQAAEGPGQPPLGPTNNLLNHPSGPLIEAQVRRAYELFYACATHSRHDPWVRLFWQVLSGALPAAALTHLQLLTASLLLALRPSTWEPAAISKAADAGLAGGPAGQVGGRPGAAVESLVTTADVHTALDKLFPARPSYKLSKLKAAYSSGVAEQAVSYVALDTLLSPLALPCPPEVLAAAVAAEVEYGTALSRTADRYFAGKSANQTSRSSSETVQERSPNVDLTAGGQDPGARIDVATPAVRAALNENTAPPATAAIGNTPMESTTDISTGPVKVVATFTQPPDVTTTFNSAFVVCWVEQLLDELEHAAAAVAAGIASSSAREEQQQQQQQRELVTQRMLKSDALVSTLGTVAEAGQVMDAVQVSPLYSCFSQCGLSQVACIAHSKAASGCTPATAAALVLQCGITGTPGAGGNLLGQSNSSGQEALTTLVGQTGSRVWTGLLTSRLAASCLALPGSAKAVHDVAGLLGWSAARHGRTLVA